MYRGCTVSVPVIAYKDKKGELHTFEGVLEGHIACRKSGNLGFGYDPVFVPDDSIIYQYNVLLSRKSGMESVIFFIEGVLYEISNQERVTGSVSREYFYGEKQTNLSFRTDHGRARRCCTRMA